MTKMTELKDVKVEDIMESEPVTVKKGEHLSDVLGKMKKHGVYELPVVENKHVVGLISYAQLMKRRKLPLYTQVDHVMLPPPELSPDMNVIDAAEVLMHTGLKAVPVTRKGKLQGMVTRTHLCNVVPSVKELASIPLENVMTPMPITVEEGQHLHQARARMKGLEENFVPVVDKKSKLVGVVGAREMVSLWTKKKRETSGDVIGKKKPVDIIVKSIMRTPVSIERDVNLHEGVKLMLKHKVPSIIITEGGEPIGIATDFDIVELIANAREREQAYVQITGLEEEHEEVYEAMYDLIGKCLKRIARMDAPQILGVHVTSHHHEGEEVKYSIHLKLSTAHNRYYTKHYDWNLLRSLDEALEQMERMVRKDKEKKLDSRKGKAPKRGE